MFLHAQIVEFPAPTAYGLAGLLVVFVALMGMALLLDARRKRALRRAGRASQWQAVDRVLEERRLSGAEASALRDVLARHAEDAPLEAVTTRLGFGRMMEAAMTHARLRMSEAEFREYGILLRDARVQLGLETTILGQQLQSTRELDGGQRVEVSAEGAERWVHLRVDDVDEAYLYLRYRDEPPTPPLPGAGQRVKCALWRDEDGRYAFTTDVVQSEHVLGKLTLAHTSDLARTQTREHFRVRHDQSTTIGILSATLSESPADLAARPPVTRMRGRITSLSAGGAAIVVQEPISKRMLLRISLELPDERPFGVHAKIVSTQPISGGRYLLRVNYLELSDEAADVISRHVMRKQQQTLADRQTRDSA